MKSKHAGGRPTLYRRECCSQIVEAMATGLSAEAAAAKIGISARSLYHWQGQHPEFLQAIQEGRQRALLWWEERALEMAGGAPGNSQLVVLALKNRSRAAHGWHHDSQKIEHSGPDGSPVAFQSARKTMLDIESMSIEDREALKGILLRVKTRSEGQDQIGHRED